MGGIILFGTPAPVVMATFGLNSISRIFSDLNIAGDPYTRSTPKIIFFELISFAVFVTDIFMFSKYMFIFNLVPCQMAVAVTSSFHMFNQRNAAPFPNEDILLHHFESVRLVIKIAKDFIGWQSLNTIVLSEVLLTIAAWLCINCYRIIPEYFVATMAAMFGGCLGTAIFILTLMANSRDVSGKIIRKKQGQFSRKSYPEISSRKYYSLKWKAQQPLPLFCGTHFAIDRYAVMNFANVLMDNTTNAVLVVIP